MGRAFAGDPGGQIGRAGSAAPAAREKHQPYLSSQAAMSSGPGQEEFANMAKIWYACSNFRGGIVDDGLEQYAWPVGRSGCPGQEALDRAGDS